MEKKQSQTCYMYLLMAHTFVLKRPSGTKYGYSHGYAKMICMLWIIYIIGEHSCFFFFSFLFTCLFVSSILYQNRSMLLFISFFYYYYLL